MYKTLLQQENRSENIFWIISFVFHSPPLKYSTLITSLSFASFHKLRTSESLSFLCCNIIYYQQIDLFVNIFNAKELIEIHTFIIFPRKSAISAMYLRIRHCVALLYKCTKFYAICKIS